MFNFGFRKRNAEAIRRGVRGSLIGAFLHPNEIGEMGLNDSAREYLFTESLAHHLFALGSVYSHLSPKPSFEFFKDAAIDGMAESQEKDKGPDSYILAPMLFDRFHVFQSLSPEERVNDEHFLLSARLVQEQDPKANIDEIANIIKLSTRKYMIESRKMF
jgi:hypothetical protein